MKQPGESSARSAAATATVRSQNEVISRRQMYLDKTIRVRIRAQARVTPLSLNAHGCRHIYRLVVVVTCSNCECASQRHLRTVAVVHWHPSAFNSDCELTGVTYHVGDLGIDTRRSS